MWRTVLLIACYALLFVGARGVRLDRPWTGGHDQVGARYSTIGRNFVREGFLDPPLVQKAWSGQPPVETRDQFMTKHPPGVPLLLAAAFWLAGSDAPWVARLVMILGALVASAILFRLTRRLAGPRVAAATTLISLAVPAAVFYGAWVDPVSWWSIAFILAALDFWFDGTRPTPQTTLREPPRPDGWGTACAIALAWMIAMLVEWNAVFVLPVFFADALATGWRRRLRPLLLLAVTTALVLTTYRIVLPTPGGLGARLSKLARFEQWDPTFFATLADYVRGLVSTPLALLAAAGALLLVTRAARRRVTTFDRAIIALIAFQVAYTFVYPIGSRVHDFCLLYAVPPIAMIAGRLVVHAHDTLRRRTSPAVAAASCGLLLAGWALWQAHTGLERAARPDAEAGVNLRTARDLTRIADVHEIIGTTRAPGRLMPIAFHADRAMLGGITTPDALRSLHDSVRRPAVLVIPKDELDAANDLVTALERTRPRRRFDTFHAFDLRGLDLERLAAGDPHTRDDARASPGDIATEVHANGVAISWSPPPGPPPVAYRVAFGDQPGVYPAMVTVPNPRIRWPTEAEGVVRFVVRAVYADGRLSRATNEHSITLRGRRRPWSNLLAIATALAAVVAGVWWIGRASDERYA